MNIYLNNHQYEKIIIYFSCNITCWTNIYNVMQKIKYNYY